MWGGEFALSLISNVVSAGLSRGYSRIARRITTRKQIEKVLSKDSANSKNTEARKAIRLLSTVVGNEYNEAMIGLFNQIIVDGFSDRLLDYAMSPTTQYDELERLFCQRYSGHLDKMSVDGEALFRSLMIACEHVSLSIFQDPNLANLLTLHSKNTNDRLMSIERNLRSLLGLAPPSQYDEKAITSKVVKFTTASTRDIAVETNRGRKRFPIDKVFVKSRLNYMTKKPKDDLFLGFDEEDDSTTYADFISVFNRTIVLGDPGGGKSTLCQSICYDLSRTHTLASKHISRTDLDLQIARIPLRVVLRECEKWHERDGINIFEFLARDISQRADENIQAITYWLRTQLTLGQAVVVFDGIDEILNVSNRRRYISQIENFGENWEATSILCTSRIIGYEKAPLSAEFEIVELSKFNREEVKKYTQSLISLIESKPRDNCESEAEQFLLQTDNNASDLRKNPLMLGLMVWLFVAQGHVPRHKAAIYSECATLMFEKWDRDRGIRADIPDDFELMPLFGRLAGKIFGNAELEGGVNSTWLERVMFEFFSSWYEENAKARNAAVRLREFITGRSWVMTDVGPGKYAFTHRTFLEYFFARSLSSKYDSVKRVIYELRSKITSREWDVICHLTIQDMCYQNSRKSEECVDALLLMQANKAIGIEKKDNILFFLSYASEYLVLSDGYVRKILRVLIEAGGASPFPFRVETPATIVARLRPRNRQLFLEEMSRALQLAIESNNSEKVGRYIAVFMAPRPGAREAGGEIESIIHTCRAESRAKVVDFAKNRLELARYVIIVYSDTFKEMYNQFGDILLTGRGAGDVFMGTSVLLTALESALFRLTVGRDEDGFVGEVIEMVEERMRLKRPLAIKAADVFAPPLHFGSYRTIGSSRRRTNTRMVLEKGIIYEYLVMATVEMLFLASPKANSAEGAKSMSKRRLAHKLVQERLSSKASPLFQDWLAGEVSMLQVV